MGETTAFDSGESMSKGRTWSAKASRLEESDVELGEQPRRMEPPARSSAHGALLRGGC